MIRMYLSRETGGDKKGLEILDSNKRYDLFYKDVFGSGITNNVIGKNLLNEIEGLIREFGNVRLEISPSKCELYF